MLVFLFIYLRLLNHVSEIVPVVACEHVKSTLQNSLVKTHLHGDHRQHFHRNPVKLIEAAPGTCLSQAFVDVATGLWDNKDKTEKETG